MKRSRLLSTVGVGVGVILLSGPAGAMASQSPTNVRHWNDIRREGLTKILYGAALTGGESNTLDRIAAELDRLGGPDPAVTTGLVTGLVARSSY